MSDFTVKGQFEMDRESVSRGAGALQGALSRVAGNIGNSFKSKILGALGAGGLSFAIKSQLDKGFATLKDARRLGLDPEEFQTLSRLAEQSGASIDELAKRYLVAREKGTSFFGDVQKAMGSLREEGLLTQASDVEKLSDAYQKLADVLGKLAPVVAHLAGMATTNPMADKGFLANLWGGAKVTAGRALEWIGKVRGGLPGDAIQRKGLEWQMSGYGVEGTEAGKTPVAVKSATPAKNPFESLVDALIEQQKQDVLKKALESNAGKGSGSQSVSSLKAMGGFMSASTSAASPAVTQLQLINRKLDDLVVSARKATL